MSGSVLIDTSVLLRVLQPAHPHHTSASLAVLRLPLEGRELHIVPQNLYELWVVATRSVNQNGLGLAPVAVESEIALFRSTFRFDADTPAVCNAWEQLVVLYHVTGKPAHDARLVAAMHVHGISAILTFDRTGFSRYDLIEVIDPATVAD
jgi:predicted nucleic acid-binding protein